MATYYLRADGVASQKDLATSDLSASTSMNLSTQQNETFAEDDVLVLSDMGGVYRETLRPPSGLPLEYQVSGSPIISGADLKTGWIAAPTYGATVFSVPQAVEPTIMAIDKGVATKGVGAGSLNDLEWFWDQGLLLLRYDSGSPDGLQIEAGTRARGIDSVLRNDVTYTLDGLTVEFANQCGFVNDGGANILLYGATFGPCGRMAPADGVVNFSSAIDGIIRGIIITPNSFGQGIFAIDSQGSLTIEDAVIGASLGAVGDGIQVHNATNVTIARNQIDLRGQVGAKGCILTNGTIDGVTCEDNRCLGGNWGAGINGDNLAVRRNYCKDQGAESGVGWAAGLYLAGVASDGAIFEENITDGCQHGMHILNGARTAHDFIRNRFLGSLRSDDVVFAAPVSGRWIDNVQHPLGD